jgi:8-oxo-dGTP pyrophosphatase MutT (NUDIX family)
MTGESQAGRLVAPLPSATVALVRRGVDGPELLLVLRHSGASFGDSYVFPGGLLEAQDYDVWHRCDGPDAGKANSILDLDNGGLAYYSAAIRELFEEAGVLLARSADGSWVDSAGFADYRVALYEGQLSWPEFLDRYDLRLACDALHYFAFWVTPREISKRFSTRFFIAALPGGQEASHCGTELTDSCWRTPAAALAESGEPGFRLPRPTQASLETLGSFADVASLLDWAREQANCGVDCKRPAIISVQGKPRIVMPDDQLYPDYGLADD